MFKTDNIDSDVILKTVGDSNNIFLFVLNCQQVELAKSHADNKRLACHLILATSIVTWGGMKKNKRHESSLTKYSSATTWANVEKLLRQLHDDRKKSLRIECLFYFGRKLDKSVPVDVNLVTSSDATLDTTATERGNKKKKTETDRLLEQREQQALKQTNLDHRCEVLQKRWECTNTICKYFGKYCWVDDDNTHYPLSSVHIRA